jgi:hypothetical protein
MLLFEKWLNAWLAWSTWDEATIVYLKSTVVSHFVTNTPWVWPLCETLHFIGLALLLGIIGPLDLRLMGFTGALFLSTLKALVPWAIAGFTINLITGALFFIGSPQQYMYNSSWWLKLIFLAIAGLNMLAFETTQRSRMKALEPGVPTPGVFKTIGALSLVSWLMVLWWGRMLPFLGNAF